MALSKNNTLFYLFLRLSFIGARCESALPAAILDFLLVRPSFKTLLAAFPARLLVFLLFADIFFYSVYNKNGPAGSKPPAGYNKTYAHS